MISGQNIVKYLLICVFTQLLMADFSFADPVPVFCLAGWLDYECCKGISRIRETAPNGAETWYESIGSRIRETAPNGEETWFDPIGSRIQEKTPAGEYILYDPIGSRIRKITPNGEETWFDTF